MDCRAIGDAGKNGDSVKSENRERLRRQSSKFYANNSLPHHGFVFKAFTKESLANIRDRKTSRCKNISASHWDPARLKPQPDPYLASGQQLPLALIRQLPAELVGKPIEDVDPYYADQETFVMISRGKELTRFSAKKALYLFGPFHPVRRIVLYILVNPIFNLLVIMTILINCVLMTIQGSEIVERTEIIFTIVYTTEMGLKVLARGFLLDDFTYLRDPWNWLDFAVIIMAYLTIVVQDLGNLSVIRTFRVLRALKTVAIIPGMKTIVGAVIDSVKNLKDVVVLTLFSLSVFSLLGLQIYMGQLTQKCILNGPTNMTDSEWFTWCNKSSHWVPEPDDEIYGAYRLCGNATGAQSCPSGYTCLQGFGPNPDYGFTNFDNFGWALICSFRLMTQDFWEGLYMQVLKTAGSWHVIFFIVSIFLGSIYLMNLILAIVAMSYNELQRRAEEEEEAAAENEAAFLESCRLMELQERLSEYSGSNLGARASYRPSVEIGLVGHSMLANLCRNGLLGQHVLDKLNQQQILPHHGEHNARSHSLCSAPQDYTDPPSMASSMTELGRKSSLRARIDTGSPTQPLAPGLPMLSRKRSSERGKSMLHFDSSCALASRLVRTNTRHRHSPRPSATSDRDLSILKQRAASIRIVSDDCSEKKPEGNFLSLKDATGFQSIGTLGMDFDNERTRDHKRFHRVSLSPSSADDSLALENPKQTCGSKKLSESLQASTRFLSEAVICRQPESIYACLDRRSSCKEQRSIVGGDMIDKRNLIGQSTVSQTICSEPPLVESAGLRRRVQNLNGSTKTLRSKMMTSGAATMSSATNVQQLGIERCPERGKMHHLSVENFQQFGVARVQQAEYGRSEGTASNEMLGQSRARVDSRGYINPTTALRSSLAQPRPSLFIGTYESGRMSKDFSRRASDWSRLSMSANVDMRRLLRLWSHTNPYQSRKSIASSSNCSQKIGSPEHSIIGDPAHLYSRSNSPRPSSVGSARQAYELISALSRRQNRFPNDQRYVIPLDDYMADKVSVNFRDKCLAYCLSGLDMLCIWECCGLWLTIQRIISIAVFDPFTELFIILCILINTLFMALDSDDVDPQMRSIFERGNYFFTATFAVEASMKIMALSPKFYFREGWNVFDSIIVCLSLLELGLEGVYGLSVLRSFRLLRVFKLAKSWPTLNLLISIMGKAVGDLGNLTFVLAIIVFIFAVMGMQLFGNKYVDHNFPSGELPRWNFTDFMHSIMIVFRILCAEWIEPMWDCLLVGGWPCIPFFLIAVTVGNLVVLNLFLALLLASFGASNLSSPQADNVDTKKLQEAIGRFKRFGRWTRRQIVHLFRSIAYLLLGNRCGGYNASAMNGGGRCEGGPKQPRKSHIVAMSKLERMKNIEIRTEELKIKIRRSPEHLYHLKQLANSQLKKSSRPDSISGTRTRSGFNFNYRNKKCSNGNGARQNGDPVPIIPIIVDEAMETCNDSEGSAVGANIDLDSFSAQSDQSQEIRQTDGDRTAPFLPPEPNTKKESLKQAARVLSYPVNMQPIEEDADSSPSLSDVFDQSKSSLKDLAQGELLHTNRWKCAKALALDYRDNTSLYRDSHLNDQLAESTGELGHGYSTDVEPAGSRGVAETPEGQRPASSLYLKAPKKEDMEDEDERALQYIESYIDNCICLGILCLRWFLFRKSVRKIVEHRYFDQCILVLIVISSGTLALEDKHLNERPTLKRTLDVLDTVFTIVFSLEMILKWLAFGMRRYFGNIWSWLDFVIVLVSLVNLMASIFGSGKIQALKTMRTLRAMRGLRPLRALQRFQGMRVVVNALIQAIPSIFNVLLVCLIFWLIFSIMGVQMFGGKFWRCLSPATGKIVSYEEAANKIECIERNLTWANPQINFDNVPNAYLALFQVATFKGWIDIMNSATDSRMRDDQPIREANIYMYLYFVFFVIFGSFFTLNLFIGVIIDNFNEQKKKTGGSLEIFMTDDQKKYYHAMKKMRSKRPTKAMTRPKFWLQAYMFDITTSKKFDMIIMLIIALNMFVMALEHYGQSQEFSLILENLNLIFIAIFTLECLSKIFAMRHFYFREPWNIFDFIVVDLSILGVVMKEYVAKYFVSPTLLRVVRVVKVGRVLRLVKGAKGIRTLLFALAMSLPALFNICLLLFLVMFIYAIFGMSFFMNVRKRSGIDETFNFETFTSSIIVLFEMSTSAGWDLVLDPLMDEENDCQKADPAQGIEGTCGNKSIAIFYLISYVIVTFLIIINMYIAVILENYSQATEDVQEGLTDDDYEMYYEIWQKFDPDGTQYLPYEKLSDFVDALEDPLRIPKPNDLALVVMDINIYAGNQCYCVDILDALTKFFFTRKGLVIQVNEHLQKVQSILHETPFERITTTYMLKRQHYCARLIQNCWRKWRAHRRLEQRQVSNL